MASTSTASGSSWRTPTTFGIVSQRSTGQARQLGIASQQDNTTCNTLCNTGLRVLSDNTVQTHTRMCYRVCFLSVCYQCVISPCILHSEIEIQTILSDSDEIIRFKCNLQLHANISCSKTAAGYKSGSERPTAHTLTFIHASSNALIHALCARLQTAKRAQYKCTKHTHETNTHKKNRRCATHSLAAMQASLTTKERRRPAAPPPRRAACG